MIVSIRTKLLLTVAVSSCTALYLEYLRRKRKRRHEAATTYEELIGNTPLIELKELSRILSPTRIYAKLESSNPGGTPKDRASLSMLVDAEERGELERGGVVVEGTSGSTGISLAHLCRGRGYECVLFLPDGQAEEEREILVALGAKVEVVPNCGIASPLHYVNRARQRVIELRQLGHSALFVNQFENQANWKAHYQSTGPEIWREMGGRVDAFVMAAGTGGTIAGVGSFLKHKSPSCRVFLVDPPGSVLHNKIKYGLAYVTQQSESTVLRHRYDTLAEGIGLDRITANFSQAIHLIDDSIKVHDQEAVDMAHWILENEGLFVGSSSAMNLVGAVRAATSMNDHYRGLNVVTILCDSGQRHVTRFWNPKFIQKWGLLWPTNDTLPQCIQDFIQIKKTA